MLPLPFDQHRVKVRALRLRMVGNQLPHSQPMTNFSPNGCPNPQSCHALALRGLVLKSNDHFITHSNGDPAQATPDVSALIDFPPLEDCPLNFHAWENELLNNPDCSSFLDGLRNSFKLLLESDTLCIDSHANDNYSSAMCDEFKPQMDQLFLNELALGRISRVTSKPKCTHPIGSVPKKDSGKSRPIMDCSGPPVRSVDDDIK